MNTETLRNYHTHTTRCLHARNTDEEYVQAALASGFKTLGFSDHTPWPYHDGYVSRIRMPAEQLAEYVESIRRLEKNYEGKIQLYVGLECEAFPQYYGWLKEQKEALGLDYLILGNHLSDEKEEGHFFLQSTRPDQVKQYTDMTLAGMESGLFTYLAHPEVVLSNYPVFDAACVNMSEQICRRALELHMPLEYNLQGNHYRAIGNYHGVGYPTTCFWEIAARMGNEAIIGVDAHNAEMMTWSKRFQAARQYLEGLGLKVLDQLPGMP